MIPQRVGRPIHRSRPRSVPRCWHAVGAVLAGIALVAAVPATEGPSAAMAGTGFELEGRILDDGVSAGNGFELRGAASSAVTRYPVAGESEALALGCRSRGSVGCACLCSALFEDGFESGDTSAWSSTTP